MTTTGTQPALWVLLYFASTCFPRTFALTLPMPAPSFLMDLTYLLVLLQSMNKFLVIGKLHAGACGSPQKLEAVIDFPHLGP